jgi:hypothetical protein
MGPAYSLERVLTLSELGADDWPKTTTGKVLKRDLQVLVNQLLEHERAAEWNRTTNVHEETGWQHFLLDFARKHDMLIKHIDDDFLGAGLDSLLALRLRNAVIKEMNRKGAHLQLGLNEIFTCGNIRRLAAQITTTANSSQRASSSETVIESTLEMMSDMVEEFRIAGPRKFTAPAKMPSTKTFVSIVQENSSSQTHRHPASYWNHWLIRRPRLVHITCPLRRGCCLLCNSRR